MSEQFIYKRKDGTRALFTDEKDMITFMGILERTGVDIDKEIDIWMDKIDKRLTEKGLFQDGIKLFFERFKMAV